MTLLFSRTETTAADNCVENDTGIARLDTTVAPYLYSLNLTGTGSIETGKTQTSKYLCTHDGDTLATSWNEATDLAQKYGWSFVSHTATYPSDISQLPPSEQYAETCGSAATLAAHGLPGAHGLIAYPGGQESPLSTQSKYGAECFAWGRKFSTKLGGITTMSNASRKPYWQYTIGVNGGACNTPGAPCYSMPEEGRFHYTMPSTIIAEIDALRPGQWLTLEAYVLVTGTNPEYTHDRDRWDCSSSNPALHWTNDEERYCYSDYQTIVNAIAAYNSKAASNGTTPITVTDPLTVGKAFGRPSNYR